METAEDITQVTPNSQYITKGISIEKILELKRKDLNNKQVADILGCDRSNVSRRLKEYKPTLERINLHKKHRADRLTSIQADILDSITPDNIKDCTLPQKTVAYGILVDKERLFRGESTTNLSIAGVIETHIGKLEGISTEITRLSQELDSE